MLASYEAITEELGETAEVRFLRAKGLFKVAHLHALLGEQIKAEAGYRQAVSLLEQLAADLSHVPEYNQKLATTHHNLGITLAERVRKRTRRRPSGGPSPFAASWRTTSPT